MNVRSAFAINLSESFPHLSRAPIVEAVIHWRVRGDRTLQPEFFRSQLTARLPDYPTVQTQQELQLTSEVVPQKVAHTHCAQWHGFRFESTERRNIAQFTRNGFVFSRVTPYENWDRFAAEAKRLWRIHVELTEPTEIERLGVRFINRIVPIDLDKLDSVLAMPPQRPDALRFPIGEFLHRTLLDVPGHPYNLNVIQTTQPPAPPETDAIGLILDIDVFTTRTIELNAAALDDHLAKMRWLKNKAFYSLLTPGAIDHFKDSKP